MPATKRSNRKEQILQALAQMLETSPGQRITTAKLAAEVGVSEAALYRHFPSKARMFEGLIEFIEDTLLSRINLILENEKESQTRVYNILLLLLTFAEKNPGITRILTGDALQGEQERLRERVQGLFEKLETQFKQVLRERKLREGKTFQSDELTLANFLLAYVEGKMNQFVRSDFKVKPSSQFEKQWPELQKIWL
ncbi:MULTISPECIES: nucleoid occlusion factor SlmA [Pseudoalteromonas]|jgi:TetR/AcrR family transcriptional regulator|uniref:Nucleoid occlusion factor SlmA n=5 Tax=Pseudoalteromonas TaxID=53246 RepID=A0AAD0U2W5_9GAMM|nr:MULTISPECIES: nucleoid occlusion factor SlmA [Pseudoalteromonas]MAJ40851.1 nucleoid occlusion factor SlmA [Pseudoalteromonadaceae bacterium]MCP4059794.1 nucleoid occlusion factor SlmA [Pseudoalteromonas sp.]MDC9520085.1 nucleoid occlusion factor SlmA [Pseudoalteromonas sp. Angola-31]MDY6887102.1 nucleoid occlusion factor SlmA [Pseudomonadota bacterium]OUX85484.1 MAG: nucleoid occlusion factor SlmA [Pseudoalteromonas sp. TMED43]|tara:strand:- start:621 stop:1208 length:588 start_codon:yes stop_codon:yes gene_type:complete